MGDTHVGRRQVLSGAIVAGGAVAAGTLGLGSSALADSGSQGDGRLAGSWMVNRRSDNDPTDRSMAVFSLAAGNVVIVHDINPAGPPFTGTWAQTRAHGFQATFWTGMSGGPGGPPGPPPVLRVHVEGSLRNGTLSGTYALSVIDAQSQAVLQSDTGTFSGQRISASA